VSPRVGQWVRVPAGDLGLVVAVEAEHVRVHLARETGRLRWRQLRESVRQPSDLAAEERRYRARDLTAEPAGSAAVHARHTEEPIMNAVQMFEAQYAGVPLTYSWRCTHCGAHNLTKDERKRDTANQPQGVFRATCSTPGCGGGFEMGLPSKGREAAATFEQLYEDQRRRDLDWARRRSHKTWDKRRAGREAPFQDGPVSTGGRPAAVPDPRAIKPYRPSPDQTQAHDDGYTTPHRAPSTDAAEWLPWQCPGCGVDNLTPPPPGFKFETAHPNAPSPASVRVRCQRCERWQTVLAHRRLVRVATATEAFARAYEGTREATAPWVEVKCPECGAAQYAPPVPSNLGRGQMAMECEECGVSMQVNPDGSVKRDDDGRRGAGAAVEAFHQVAGDTVRATLVTAEGAAVQTFRESYNARQTVPDVPAGMRARIRQWR
jgi:ribosomal protein S27E